MSVLGVPRVEWLPEQIWRMDFGEFYMVYGGLVLVFNTVERSGAFRSATDVVAS